MKYYDITCENCGAGYRVEFDENDDPVLLCCCQNCGGDVNCVPYIPLRVDPYDASLSFGSIDACQAGIGISCDECIYYGVCIGEDFEDESIARRT